MTPPSPRSRALHVVTASGVVLGIYPPSIRVDRSRRVIPQVGLPEMEAGISSPVEWVVVVAGCCVVGGALLAAHRTLLGGLSVAAGGLALFECFLTLRNPLVGVGGPFLPTWAWALTTLAGLGLVGLGLFDLRPRKTVL